MSLILDALNRARQDAGQMPGLATNHYVGDAAATTARPQWALRATLVLAVLLIAWLLAERWQQAASGPTVEGLSEPVQQVVQPESMPVEKQRVESEKTLSVLPAAESESTALVPQIESSEVPAAVVDPGIAELYRQPRPLEDAPVDPRKPVVERAPESAGTVSEPARQPVARPREEEPVDIEKLVAEAREEVKEARLVEHEVPFLTGLSQQVKDGIPTLLYQRHDYAGGPAQSSVLINGKTLRAGSSAGGVKVEEILPDSVILSYQGIRFRLRALNSWVNL